MQTLNVSSPAVAARFPAHALPRMPADGTALPGVLRKLAAGETLFAEGDEAESAFEVVSGMLRVYRMLSDGRRQITGFLSEGRIVAIPPEGVWLTTVEAANEVAVRCFRRAAVEQRLDTNPAFARRLLAAASLDLRQAQDQALLLGRKSATEKVASFLLQMSAMQDDADVLSLPVRRGDIADYLGLTVETVSRCFTRLKTTGVIALPTPTMVEITDRARLEDCADGFAD